MSYPSADQLQRFSFDAAPIRGEVAHLNATYEAILNRHDCPPVIRVALGQLLAATALMSASLKFKGRLTLQIRLPGAISLLQAETNELGELRAIARYDSDQPEATLTFATEGQLVITLEPEQGQRYQGITAIPQGDIATALEDYFSQSEQLPTRFWLCSDGTRAAGFMLQKLPASQQHSDEQQTIDQDAWDRVSHLAATIKDEELLELDNDLLLQRLYHEEDVRVYPATPLSFACTCSRDRLANALHQVGYQALAEMMEESGSISVDCEFCHQHYEFGQHDMAELFPENNLH
ncbi:Hsp33 family molecular chaperone HslO [Oceanobacter sp. 3_MG-2023]|uniref:Hsp33 family molecular chaperone HslO n=2 Tax=Gammaproteobacteria TaxID=1236 RepID=UPI0027366521|nr:Hsp33 family molecular chaperone HslO [Oceanobacter sp. 3_MG-2023]MDP2504508.1 Hsp33 family molecular chaperone HslO [Oceanobacter sp. 3_MG-2023]